MALSDPQTGPLPQSEKVAYQPQPEKTDYQPQLQQPGYQPQPSSYQPQQTGYQPQPPYQPQQTGSQPQQPYQQQPGYQPRPQQTGCQPQPQIQYNQPSDNQQVRVIYQQSRPRATKTWPNYKSRQSLVLGWLQIIVGILSIVFNAVGIALQSHRINFEANGGFYSGSGFWSSIFFFLSGGFALGASKHKTSCMIIANMVLSIFSSLFGIGLLSTGAIVLGIENSEICEYKDYTYDYTYDCTPRHHDGIRGASMAIGSFLLLLSFVGIISAIWSSTLSCATVCCGRNKRATMMNDNPAVAAQYMNTPDSQNVAAHPYQPPAQPYQPPAQQYQPPAQQYQPPAQQYQPTAPQYQPPAQQSGHSYLQAQGTTSAQPMVPPSYDATMTDTNKI